MKKWVSESMAKGPGATGPLAACIFIQASISVLCACVNLNPWLRGSQMEVKPESQASLLLLPLKPTPYQV